ncbi:MAG: peptide deformylase [Planctomycetota bacterium]
MEIVKYPDPILRRGGKAIDDFDAQLADTAREMLESMYRQRGVGLAAPQVGLDLSLLVLNPSGDPEKSEEEMTLINPKLKAKKGREWGEEGCLSFPGIYAEVERYKEIVVVYQDLQGEEQSTKLTDFLARVVQHEMDHLQGVLFVDRLGAVDRIRVKPQLLEMERVYKGAPA